MAPTYRATAKGYMNRLGLIEPGTEFDYDGKPSPNWMEPVDEEAVKAFRKAGLKVTEPSVRIPEVSGEEAGAPKGKAGKEAPKGKAGKSVPEKLAGSTGDQSVLD